MVKIALLGSTGSIGRQVLKVVDRYPERFSIVSLACGSNAELFAEQINKYKPRIACLADAERASLISEIPAGTSLYTGENSSIHAVTENADVVFVALSGFCGLAPTLAAKGADALPQVPPDVRPCYAFAFDLKRQSDGAFDPVIGEALRRTGFTRVSNVDLGAVAKGFAVDRAWEKLKDGDLLLDLGGNLRVVGGTWRTGVRNPFGPGYAAVIALTNGEAIATSGNYERFVEKNGVRYSHILDGRTGESVTGIAGVTVVAPSAMLADGLSTTLFVLGPKDGIRFLKTWSPDVPALWIPDTPDAPEIIATEAMAVRLSEAICPVRRVGR